MSACVPFLCQDDPVSRRRSATRIAGASTLPKSSRCSRCPATRYTAASGRGCYRSSKSVGRRLVTAGALLAFVPERRRQEVSARLDAVERRRGVRRAREPDPVEEVTGGDTAEDPHAPKAQEVSERMIYQPKAGPGRKLTDADIAAHRAALPNSTTPSASTYEQDRATLDRLRADLKAKYPDSVEVKGRTIGPKEAEMLALRKLANGDAGQASSVPTTIANRQIAAVQNAQLRR